MLTELKQLRRWKARAVKTMEIAKVAFYYADPENEYPLAQRCVKRMNRLTKGAK